MASKKKINRKTDAGVVFPTDSEKINDESIKEDLKNLSYDPFELTAKIIEFGKALTGIPLYTYQEHFAFRVIFAVITCENEALSALWARQSGKSEDMAFIIDTLCVILPTIAPMFPELKMFANGVKIGLYAPQQLQVDTTYDRAMERISSENAEVILDDPGISTGLVSTKYLELTNKSMLTGQVANKSSKIESKTYHLIILEEAQDLDDYVVQKSIEPMTSATGGTILKVGTTGSQKNHFYYDIQNNIKRQRGVKDPRMMFHFQFDYKQVIEYKRMQYEIDKNPFHLLYEKDVLKKRGKWGEASDPFKLGYALQWPLDSGMFVTDQSFNGILNKKLGFPDHILDDWIIAAGIDWGETVDSTVLTIGRVFYPDNEYTTEPPKKQLIGWVELSGVDYESQHHIILQCLNDYGVQVLYSDYTGVGKPPTERLMAACGEYVSIVPYPFSRPSKSDMWIALDADIKAGRLIVPASKKVRETEVFKKFEDQLKNLYKSYEGGYMVCQHGDEPGAHDDYPDSLGLFCLAANAEMPEEMDDSENPFYEDDGSYGVPSYQNLHW